MKAAMLLIPQSAGVLAKNSRSGKLHLAQAQSNRGRRGRKRDFPDAERLVKRLVARELTLSFVPDAEQRLWRTVTRRKYQLTRDRVRLNNQLESLLEEAHIKLSSLVSDLIGASGRRMLMALAEGETNPATLAALADERLRAAPADLIEQLNKMHPLDQVKCVQAISEDLERAELPGDDADQASWKAARNLQVRHAQNTKKPPRTKR